MPNDQPSSQRKQATVIFADLSGFTAMSETLDPEEVREIVNRYFESLSAAVRRYEGTIDKYIGDCVMAVFGVPATRENDAERACCAALDMQQATRELAASFERGTGRPPELHIGVNTGLVVAAAMGSGENSQYTVMGDAVNLASRLCHEAENGEIAVGEATWEQVRYKFGFAPKELRSIKGKSEKVPLYFLQSRVQESARPTRLQVRMVGRARELALAQDLMDDARARHGTVLYITGVPGIGKSRLSSEMSVWAAQNGVRVLSASALPLEAIQPYSLWRQLLEQLSGVALGVNPAESQTSLEVFLRKTVANNEQVVALRATFGLASPEFELLDEAERFDSICLAWKELLHRLQMEHALLLIVDDLQWADAQSVQLLNALVDFLPSLALLLCCQARPEFQHNWAGRSYYQQITLRPLSPEESTELAQEALKDKPGGSSRESEVVRRAEGNPFYLTELARAAAEREDDKLPPTIEGVILERIDRLEKDARQLLELASVIGREFPERLLRVMAETENLESELRRLRELEFVYEKEIVPELLYLFKHYLTQEATYNSILIQRRKELHKQIAIAMEGAYKENLDRYYSVLAQHYERGGEYQRASEYFRLAGEKAQGIQSDAAAVELYERGESALQMLHEDRPVWRSKIKTILLMAAVAVDCIVNLRYLDRPVPGGLVSRLHPIYRHILYYFQIGLLLFSISYIGVLIFSAQRWSFLVYPDRVRLRSKRRTVDIPFDQITKIEVITYRNRPTPSVVWLKLKRSFNPWYPKFGMGQAGVLYGVREIIRIDCATGWKKGYTLDVENPRAFLVTLNRALARHGAICKARLAAKA
jgi:class 3 adenylate cyclase